MTRGELEAHLARSAAGDHRVPAFPGVGGTHDVPTWQASVHLGHHLIDAGIADLRDGRPERHREQEREREERGDAPQMTSHDEIDLCKSGAGQRASLGAREGRDAGRKPRNALLDSRGPGRSRVPAHLGWEAQT